jgi:magnesium chelatase subunit I
MTGKFELEYEGEMRGADVVAREVIRQATAKIFRKYYDGVPLHGIVKWFEMGGSLRYAEGAPSEEVVPQFKKIQGLIENIAPLGIKAKDDHALQAAGAEFILEGLYALKKISRNEELGYHAETRRSEPVPEEAGPSLARRRSLN